MNTDKSVDRGPWGVDREEVASGSGTSSRIFPPRPLRLVGLPCLVIDDNAPNRRILEEMLRHWNMKPASVSGGEEALAELKRAAESGNRIPWFCWMP